MNRDKLFHIYWGVAFCAIPLYLALATANDGRISKDVLTMVLVGVSYCLFGLTKELTGKTRGFIASFLIVAFIVKDDLVKVNFFYHYTMILMTALFSIQFISNSRKEYLDIFLKSILIAGVTQSIFSIINHFGHNIYDIFFLILNDGTNIVKRYPPNGATGTMGNQNVLGSLIAISLPTSFTKKRIWFAPLLILGIYLSNSLAPIISAIVGVLIYIIYSYRKNVARWCVGLGVLCLSVLSFALPLYFKGIDPTKRLIGWAKLVKHISIEKLFLGHGAGYLKNNYGLWQIERGTYLHQAHNEYLELFFTFGLVGFFIVFFFVKNMYPKDIILFTIFTVGLVNSFFHFAFHISITALILLGALCFNDRNKNVSILER
jgi:hypothetical protein